MSIEPKVPVVREVGRTTDPHRFAVKVERTAWLDERLIEITGRCVGHIHLVAHDGYADAQVWHLDPEQANGLIAALENAVDDLREAKRWNVDPAKTDPTPEDLDAHSGREGEQGEPA